MKIKNILGMFFFIKHFTCTCISKDYPHVCTCTHNLCFRGALTKITVKFLNFRTSNCNLPKIQTKRPNLRIFRQKDANGMANSEDHDQTAPLGAV